MQIKNLSALFVFAASAVTALAAPIATSAATDRKIEEAAKSSYNFRAVLDNHVTATSADGVVTLTGNVEDKDDRNLAADTVANLPGVTSVNNQVKVEPAYPEHSDGWIGFKIHCLLLVKANVSSLDTKVAVTNGNVILTGTADSIAQKELTSAYAKDIEGVKSVKNDIVVKDKPVAAVINESIDDASITSQVNYALSTNKATSAIKTKVTTTNGAVRIIGDANSDAEKALVTKLTTNVRGVKSVANDMTVKS